MIGLILLLFDDYICLPSLVSCLWSADGLGTTVWCQCPQKCSSSGRKASTKDFPLPSLKHIQILRAAVREYLRLESL